jgi:hypothetical protein
VFGMGVDRDCQVCGCVGVGAWEFELKDAAGNTLALIDRCVCVVVCFWCVGRGERAVGV